MADIAIWIFVLTQYLAHRQISIQRVALEICRENNWPKKKMADMLPAEAAWGLPLTILRLVLLLVIGFSGQWDWALGLGLVALVLSVVLPINHDNYRPQMLARMDGGYSEKLGSGLLGGILPQWRAMDSQELSEHPLRGKNSASIWWGVLQIAFFSKLGLIGIAAVAAANAFIVSKRLPQGRFLLMGVHAIFVGLYFFVLASGNLSGDAAKTVVGLFVMSIVFAIPYFLWLMFGKWPRAYFDGMLRDFGGVVDSSGSSAVSSPVEKSRSQQFSRIISDDSPELEMQTPVVIQPIQEGLISDVEINRIYAVVAREVAEKRFEQGLLARANVECDGDKERVELLYIKYRKEQYVSALQKRRQEERDALIKTQQEQRKKKLADERIEREAMEQSKRAAEQQLLDAAQSTMGQYWELRKKYGAINKKIGICTIVLFLSSGFVGVFSMTAQTLCSFGFLALFCVFIIRSIRANSPSVIIKSSKISLDEYLRAKRVLEKNGARK